LWACLKNNEMKEIEFYFFSETFNPNN
jgi:hypothetical protein